MSLDAIALVGFIVAGGLTIAELLDDHKSKLGWALGIVILALLAVLYLPVR